MLSTRSPFRTSPESVGFSIGAALRLSRQASVLIPLVLAATVAVIVVLLASRFEQEQAELEGRLATQAEAEDIRSHLETRLAAALAPVEGIALMIGANGLPPTEAFATVGEELAKREPLFLSLALAPDLVIREVYPRAENIAAIGVDFRSVPVDEGALRAFETQQMVLAGPLTLRQGGEALAVRVPYRITQGEWRGDAGLISITMDFPGLLREVGLADFARRHPSALRRIDADGRLSDVFYGDAGVDEESALAIDLRVPGARWRWLIDAESGVVTPSVTPAVAYGGPAGALVVVLVWLLALNRTWSSQLARRDALSGLPNRRALFDRLTRVVERRESLAGKRTVIALDLDGFKAINDAFGHGEGDRTIARVGDLLQTLRGLGVWPARRSGDEFVLLLESADPALLKTVKEKIDALPEHTRVLGEDQSGISASIGVAVLRHSDLSADDWLRRADDALYEAKRARRPELADQYLTEQP